MPYTPTLSPESRARANRYKYTGLILAVVLLAGWSLFEAWRYSRLDTESLLYTRASSQLSTTLREFNMAALKTREDMLKLKLELLSSGLLTAGATPSRQELERVFAALPRSGSMISQIRWLDETGQERARLDRSLQPDGSWHTTSAAALQNKADRYYFRDYVNQPGSALHLSRLDLNQEFGRIVSPLEPTLRVMQPTTSREGLQRGVLVINYNLAPLFKELRKKTVPGVAVEIFDENGHWLYNTQSPSLEWARDFQRTGPTLLGEEPGLARRLHGWDDFQIDRTNYRLIISMLDPGRGDRIWIHTYPLPQALSANRLAAFAGQLPALITTLLLVLALIWLVRRVDRSQQTALTQLDQIRNQLRTVLDGVPAMIAYWDRNLVNRVANRAYADWYDLNLAQLPGQRMREALGDARFEAIEQHVQSALRGEDVSFESESRTPTGRSVHTLSHYLPDRHGNQVAGFYVIAHDVSELTQNRQQLSAALREKQVLLRTIDEQMLYSVTDTSGRIIEVNDNFCQVSGFRRDELVGNSHNIINSGVHPPEMWESLWATISSGRPWRGEICNRARDGSLYWVDSVIAPYLGADGLPERYVSLRNDVTARKRAEAELEQVNALLRNLLASATEFAIIATGVNGVITLFNAGAERMLGYSADDVIGQITPERFHLAAEVEEQRRALAQEGLDGAGFRAFIARTSRDGAEAREWTYVTRDGAHLPVSLVVTGISDSSGRLIGYLGIAENILERKRAEAALGDALREAKSASAAKSTFLANMSHEIRTPMNAVIGIAHLLERSRLDEEQRELLGKLLISGRSLMGIINDVLDIAKIEAGEMHLEATPFSPATLLRELDAVYRPQIEAKGLAFSIAGTHRLPVQLVGDEQRLRQILVNLVGNALKFTSAGDIRLEVECNQTSSGSFATRWSVVDTGCGIAPEVQAQLFTPFTQADASVTRRFGGTGLGLSIVRQFALLMGGSVGLTSALGEGSTFSVELPFAAADTSGDNPASGQQIEVWVVDDEPADLDLLVGRCRALGWRPTGLGSATALLAESSGRLSRDLPLPDALLIDWHMPDMDGLQALREMAEQLGRERLPASLVVSAAERDEVEAHDPTRVADRILTKPVDSSTLFNAVNESIAHHQGSTELVMQTTRFTHAGARWLPGVRLLLVDDSEINLDVARRLLESEGAVVTVAHDGEAALERLGAAPQDYDAVLMDVQMPVMDGYEATRRIRESLGLRRLPVIALTAGALQEERRRAEAAGMDDFLTKPLDPETMIRVVRLAIERAHGRPLAIEPRPPEVDEPSDWPRLTGFDATDARVQTSGDLALYYKLLARFVRENADLAGIAEPVEYARRDHAGLASRMHKLRGTAALLGARDLATAAGELEAALRSDTDDERLASLLAVLHTTLTQALSSAEECHAKPSEPAAEPVGTATLQLLHDQLGNGDLAAIASFQALAPGLRASAGEALVHALEDALDALDFHRALETLKALPVTADNTEHTTVQT